MPPPPSSHNTLSIPLSNLTTLLQTLQTALSHPLPKPTTSDPPNALSLLHDSSSLLHAQTTKLSLLLLTPPFTPTAIASILTSISSSCLPGLMTVWELCDARRYSSTLQEEIRVLLRDMVTGMLALVGTVSRDENVKGEGKREEILQATGQVWQVCERMNKVAGMGITGVAVEKAKAWYALVKDAVEEIEAWDPDEEEEEEDEEDEEGSLFGSSDSSEPTEQKGNINNLPNGTAHATNEKNNTDTTITPALSTLHIHTPSPSPSQTLKTYTLPPLKLLQIIYAALIKNRISTFPPFHKSSPTTASSSPFAPEPKQIALLDNLLRSLHSFSSEIDEIAASLYSHDADDVKRRLGELRGAAERCVDAVRLDWERREDGFSQCWSGIWVRRMRETIGW